MTDFLDVDVDQLNRMSVEEIQSMTKRVQSEMRSVDGHIQSMKAEIKGHKETLKHGNMKLMGDKRLPYLVSKIVELVDPAEAGDLNIATLDCAKTKTRRKTKEEIEEDKAREEKLTREERALLKKTHCIVTGPGRKNIYVPSLGMLTPGSVMPGDLIAINKDTYLPIEKMPPDYDSRVKAMEVDQRPTETYSDVGGLSKQIEELVEAVVLPFTEREKFDALGIKPPKGVIMYGPPGTGKTLLARACAAQTKCAFLKIAASQLSQKYIGEGAQMIREAFALAKQRGNTIIFIDEIDAIGGRRHESEHGGDHDTQRTMLELLNQMDGFSSAETIKVIAATNRIDILDPALLRSGRFDRKIEFPLPDEDGREEILKIHAKKMKISENVNFGELARLTNDFNGAQLKAVCVEAGMFALRRDGVAIEHEDFVEGVSEVQAKKKKSLDYYA